MLTAANGGRIYWRVKSNHPSRLIASIPLHLDFELTGSALTTGLRRMQELLLEIAAQVRYAKCRTFCEEGGMSPEELQDGSWQQNFADHPKWWEHRRSKPNLPHPAFWHKKVNDILLLGKLHKPACVAWRVPTRDAGMKRPPDSVSISGGWFGPHVCHWQVGMCRKLCEDGRITDAVNVLNLLVQRGCYVPNNLFYCVLKRCKDLVLGRHIHDLSIKCGYEGDAFVATHLIGLYASHGMLEEAMRVFTKVSKPDAYNWAMIIFTYTKHGEAATALRLYRQMHESTAVQPDNRIYVAALKACATAGDLDAGKQVHGHILASPGKLDTFVQSGLVDMYAKCGSLEDARRVFDKLPEKNVVLWTVMISAYAKEGMGQEALSLYSTMPTEGLNLPDTIAYVCLLQACASVGAAALRKGQLLHAQINEQGLQDDVVLASSLVNMYAKCGSLEDARRIFEILPGRNVVLWTTMIASYAQQGMGLDALRLYSNMQQEGLTPDSVAYVCLLKACACVGVGALDQGKQLHAHIVEQGLQDDGILGSSLLNMYAKCGRLEDARSLFDGLPKRNTATWTTMIACYAQQGMGQEALCLYSSMQQKGLSPPDSISFVCLLKACESIGVGALDKGKQLHVQIQQRGLQYDVAVGGSLVNMYAKCGSMEDARRVFDQLPDRNVVTWTVMIAGYVQNRMGQEALNLYCTMQQEGHIPDSVTYLCLLQACASVGVGARDQGKRLHTEIEERGLEDDVLVGGSLVNMYAKTGSLQDARCVFDSLPNRNIATWNAMIAGYAKQGMGQEALGLYGNMQQEGLTPDSVAFVCLLLACASVGVGALDQGKQLHFQIEEQGLESDVVIGGSLVNMYVKCGSLEEARNMFDRLPERNVVTWNVMLAGYGHQGMGQEALVLYAVMQKEGITHPDSVTFVCLLQACASIAALALGKQLHMQIEERGLQADLVVGAALVNMYAKCGSTFDSQRVFDSLPERTIEAWGALTGGYSRQGHCEMVFDLLNKMKLEGIQPDVITFLSLLTVCSHVGLVNKGREYFEAMWTEYSISPTVEHYACMVDLLGRAGHLDEALQMAMTMPFPPNEVVWVTLLGASQKWKNVEIGQLAFEGAVSVDGNDASFYVLMSNIYANAQMWEKANELQARRVKYGAWKKPGQSWWTDIGGVVHAFAVGDKRHPESEAIYARLQELIGDKLRTLI